MRRDMRPVIRRQRTPSGEPDGMFLIRPGPTFINDEGRMVEQPRPAGFRALCSVQPVSGKALRLLPEGAHAEDWRQVWVAALEEITPSDRASGRRGHTILAFGVEYEFRVVEDWRADGGYVFGRVEKIVP